MSTHGPSFVISKKVEGLFGLRTRRRRLAATCLIVLLAALGGCIVTDKIDFEDEVNLPLSIREYYPAEGIFSVCATDIVKVWVNVWDPDVDQDRPEIEGLITFASERWNKPKTGECYKPVPSQEDQVTIYTVHCQIDLEPYGIYETELLTLNVKIADLGFTNSNESREGSNEVDVNWTIRIRLESDENCK